MYELIIPLSGLGSVEPRALAATSTLEIEVMRAAQTGAGAGGSRAPAAFATLAEKQAALLSGLVQSAAFRAYFSGERLTELAVAHAPPTERELYPALMAPGARALRAARRGRRAQPAPPPLAGAGGARPALLAVRRLRRLPGRGRRRQPGGPRFGEGPFPSPSRIPFQRACAG